MSSAAYPSAEDLRGYIEYLRDLGVYDLFRAGEPADDAALQAWFMVLTAVQAAPAAHGLNSSVRPSAVPSPVPRLKAMGTGADSVGSGQVSRPSLSSSPFERSQRKSEAAPDRTGGWASAGGSAPPILIAPPLVGSAAPLATLAGDSSGNDTTSASGIFTPEMPRPTPFNQLVPLPAERIPPDRKTAALQVIRENIGDCTRCPLAYAGRHTIVFSDGDPQARLMFVGEGPGADEDASGLPFVGKAGQLLNNMIAAMGLAREAVYIANIVKCRPPQNRTPEPVEANTCSPFLLQQIDVVQPEVIVALGSTAATYLLGVKQPLASLRGQWFDLRGSKCAVTYHPAFLLRDPRQKGEAWKDLQRVMVELKLKPPARATT